MVSDDGEAGRLLASRSSGHDDLLQEGGGLSGGTGGLHGMIEHGRGGEGVVLKVESNDAKVVKLRVTHFLLCVLHLMKDYINEDTYRVLDNPTISSSSLAASPGKLLVLAAAMISSIVAEDPSWRSYCEEGTFPGVSNTFRKSASPKRASRKYNYLILGVSISKQVAGGQDLLDCGGRPRLEVELEGRCMPLHQIHLEMFVREDKKL